ncbi:MAG: branched-chain amino acid ABC transporter permease [Desulfarculus sp.]|jgi:branched-chain amino acid transport system permease protein|nr:MAG: branched-chain amino acid ABC transporter permease [Desulfarculus sp.]
MEAIRNAFDFTDLPRGEMIIAALALLFLLLFPVLPHSSFAMATMIQFLMFSLYGMGWNLIGGYGGQVDLGKAQYVGIGAYTTALLMIRLDVPFWYSLPVGLALAVIWSFIIGYPLFRLKGHYFAIATIATSLVLKDIFEVWNFVGGARGLEIPLKGNLPNWLYLQFKQDYYYFYVLLAMFLVGLIYVNGFRHSRLGFQLRAIKDNENVARSLGIDAHWCKIKAYATATAFVAAVGSFHACYNFNIEPEDVMSLDLSVLIALMAMLGGAGSMWGPIIGAAILVPMKSYLGDWLGGKAGMAGMDLLLYGAIIMFIAAVQPRGVYGIVEALRARRRR